MTLSDTQARTLLLTAWEASCERLRNNLAPPVGYPVPTSEEVHAAFTRAAQCLHALRVVCTIPDANALPPEAVDQLLEEIRRSA